MVRRADGENEETVEEEVAVSSRFILMLILGFALVVVGVVAIFIAAVFYGGGSVSGGAVIFIGPFPIVIGAGPDAAWLVLFSIIIAVLSIVVFLVMNRKMRSFGV
jgi:uncharacterized membrane protein